MYDQLVKDLSHFLKVPHVAVALFVALLIRWFMSSTIPLGHDEAYYWDWGRQLQLSYYDHPPGVAWLSWLGQSFGGSLLAVRFWLPLIHLAATLMLASCTSLMAKRPLSNEEAWVLFGSTQLSPILSAGGIMLLPDIGLIFFMSVFLWLILQLALSTKAQAGLGIFIMTGLVGGMAFCFKYHAGPMVSGSMLCLFWFRREYLKTEYLGWIASVTTGFLAVIPVLYWNSQHHWISLFYQSRHGFGGLEFHFDWFLRILIAVPLLAGPVLCLMIIHQFINHWQNPVYVVLGSCIIPLAFLILILSAFKEILPHWIMPCIWLGIPAAVLASANKNYWLWNFIYGGLILLALVILLAPAPLRNQFPQWLDNKPGGLGQITLWKPLVDYLENIDYQSNKHFKQQKIQQNKNLIECLVDPYIASLRWFWVAQLAYNLPDQPTVLDFDPTHLSYYSFRDRNLKLDNCRVVVIGDTRSYNPELFYNRIELHKESRLRLEHHQDQEIIILWGRILKKPPSRLWKDEDGLN